MGTEVYIISLLTSALDGNEWSTSRLGRFTTGNNTGVPLDRSLGVPQQLEGVYEKKNSYSVRETNTRSSSLWSSLCHHLPPPPLRRRYYHHHHHHHHHHHYIIIISIPHLKPGGPT